MYYCISTQILNDGTPSQGVVAFEELNAAKGDFHSIMASNYANQNIKACSCGVVDDSGLYICQKYIGNISTNEKYYVVSIQTTNEDEHPCSVFAYDDLNSALSSMESTLASNCVSETLKSSACFTINVIGGRIDGDFVPEEPEPEPNEGE